MTWMKTVQNDLDSHGLSWTDAVDLAQNRPVREAVGNQRRYALVVVQAGEEEEEGSMTVKPPNWSRRLKN